MDELSNRGELFAPAFLEEIRGKFLHIEKDPVFGSERLFFDNAGGSLRLKVANEAFQRIDELPDCPERQHRVAFRLQEIQKNGEDDIRLILNAGPGSIVTDLTASQVIFNMTGVIAENIAGTNIVTTALEHPSAYDAAQFYAEKLGKELRVAKTNRITGGVDVDAILSLIDDGTILLSVIFASNISGSVLDMESIVRECRRKKPDLYILCDAVQHAPHERIDLQRVPIDAINFAPYKFFGPRGFGIGYVSERTARLPHHKLRAKPEGEWELGSPAPAHFAAVSAIVDYICWIGQELSGASSRAAQYSEGMKRINLHERALMHRLLNGSSRAEGLRAIEGVKVFLDYEDLSTRDLIVAMGFDQIGFTDAVRAYERAGVIVFDRIASSLYSGRMLRSFGMEGAVRISPLHCHSVDEIDRFLEITKRIAHELSAPPNTFPLQSTSHKQFDTEGVSNNETLC